MFTSDRFWAIPRYIYLNFSTLLGEAPGHSFGIEGAVIDRPLLVKEDDACWASPIQLEALVTEEEEAEILGDGEDSYLLLMTNR